MTKEEAKQIVEEAEQTLNANYEFASKRLELSEKYGCISLEVQQFERKIRVRMAGKSTHQR